MFIKKSSFLLVTIDWWCHQLYTAGDKTRSFGLAGLQCSNFSEFLFRLRSRHCWPGLRKVNGQKLQLKGGAGQRCAVDGGRDWSSLCTVLQPWPPAPWVFLVQSSSWHHLKTFFLSVWLVLLNLCVVEGSGNYAGGHGGYQVQVLKHQKGQGGCVQYFWHWHRQG